MELTKEQRVLQQVINEAWGNEAFKQELMKDPGKAIEQLTGEKLVVPEGKTMVVRDQTAENTIYINIPAEEGVEDVELNEEQLQAVSGGVYGDGCTRGLPKPFNPLKDITFQ